MDLSIGVVEQVYDGCTSLSGGLNMGVVGDSRLRIELLE